MGSSTRYDCVNFYDVVKQDSDDILSCPYYLLQGLVVQNSAIFKPGSDAQDALNNSSVESGKDGEGLPKPLQKVKMLLGFSIDGADVGQVEFPCQVNNKEFGALDNTNEGSVNESVDWLYTWLLVVASPVCMLNCHSY